MIDFRPPRLEDREWAEACFRAAGFRGCEYNFTNLFVWGRAYGEEIARRGDDLLVSLDGPWGWGYLFPAGAGDPAEDLKALEADAAERGEPLRLFCVTPEQQEVLDRLWPGGFVYTRVRDSFDYLYEIDRLAELEGKKLHAKRNHIHRFEDNAPDWVYEELTPAAMDECMEMDREWYRRAMEREGLAGAPDLGAEGGALQLAMEHFRALGLEGGLLRAGGRVVAFTLGDLLSADTFDVHFEKAYGEIQGAYAMINREFARQVRARHPEVKYLNREDDMGLEGLRKAKESYYPDRMVEKYTAEKRGAQ